MTSIMESVDAVFRCVRDMEAVFADTKFTDNAIPLELLDRVFAAHAETVDVRADSTVLFHRAEEDDHYEFKVSAKRTDGIDVHAFLFMYSPTVYDPYESHDDEDSEYHHEVVTLQWPSRYVSVTPPDEGVVFKVCEAGAVEVWLKKDCDHIPEDFARSFAHRGFSYSRPRGASEAEKRRGARIVQRLNERGVR